MQPPADWTLRPAEAADREPLARLLRIARWKHEHLDWINSLDLLGETPFLVAERRDQLLGCLACPPDPPRVAWVRLFAVAAGVAPRQLWARLWPEAARQAARLGARQAAALPTATWLGPLLQPSGFQMANRVVFLEWRGTPLPAVAPTTTRQRAIAPGDLDSILDIDHRAFAALWQYSRRSMAEALRQAAFASLGQGEEGAVGYQISTASAFGAHLARLAVLPTHQRQGLGTALVVAALERLSGQGFDRVTVNTQADNADGLRLYQRLGFKPTGQAYPVYEARLG